MPTMLKGQQVEIKVNPESPESHWVKATIVRVFKATGIINPVLYLAQKEDGFICHRIANDIRQAH